MSTENDDCVYRTTDSFPAGDPCVLCIDDLPDDEYDYYWTEHYEKESRERSNPDVTDEIVAELLTTGTVRSDTKMADRYYIQKEIDGHEWTIVVADRGIDVSPRWAMVTIWSNYHGSVGTTNRYLDRKQRNGVVSERRNTKYGDRV